MSENTEKVVAFVDPVQHGRRPYNNGYVLSATGPAVEFELEQMGRSLEDWLIEEIPGDGCPCVGIMVWEGECENAWCMYHGSDWEPRLRGAWRKPTTEELQALIPADMEKGEQ